MCVCIGVCVCVCDVTGICELGDVTGVSALSTDTVLDQLPEQPTGGQVTLQQW